VGVADDVDVEDFGGDEVLEPGAEVPKFLNSSPRVPM
jgi:hypothetical protein